MVSPQNRIEAFHDAEEAIEEYTDRFSIKNVFSAALRDF